MVPLPSDLPTTPAPFFSLLCSLSLPTAPCGFLRASGYVLEKLARCAQGCEGGTCGCAPSEGSCEGAIHKGAARRQEGALLGRKLKETLAKPTTTGSATITPRRAQLDMVVRAHGLLPADGTPSQARAAVDPRDSFCQGSELPAAESGPPRCRAHRWARIAPMMARTTGAPYTSPRKRPGSPAFGAPDSAHESSPLQGPFNRGMSLGGRYRARLLPFLVASCSVEMRRRPFRALLFEGGSPA